MSAEPRRIILLVYGYPGNGKSYLAETLQNEHAFEILSVDDTYVEFIRSRCPMLYLEVQEYYVGPHYQAILLDREYSKTHFGRDFFAEWRSYLYECIRDMAARHERLVAEGDLLRDCKDRFEAELKVHARVFQIEVVNRSYRCRGTRLSPAQIAALGVDEAPSRASTR